MSKNSKMPNQTSDSTTKHKTISIKLDNLEDMDRSVRQAVNHTMDAALNVGDTIKDTIRKVKTARDSVVMVRVNKETLGRLDELVDSGLNGSRSEAAAFMIAEGVKSKKKLFLKISEQTEVIRKAREELRMLLDVDDVTT